MNKAELINSIAERIGVSKKQAEDMYEAMLDIITKAMKEGKEVTLTGFGTFMPKVRSARGGVNPQKPSERIQIPEVTIPAET